ncbi:MAG: MG2 domain-containing protein, partial [Pirellulales bacterium]|nr:MG2 domain-containing protein [Pirellulales bacterium]
LKNIPVADYDDLLEKGNVPDTYRPTLYDVLAHSALQFYSAGEQAASGAEDLFQPSADSPIFAPVEDFLSWTPKTTDQDSVSLRAIKLYQDLIRFHQQDDDPSALLDANLHRLDFAYDRAFGEEKAARYKAALERFADRHHQHAISARALYNLALVVHQEDDWVKAHQIAQQGLQRFPESVGGKRCFNLIQQIEASQASVSTERVWNAPQPKIEVSYRNVDKVFLRLVRFDFEQTVREGRWRPEQLTEQQQQRLLRRNPVKAWSAELPPTKDFQERKHALDAPVDVPTGSYFLIASHNSDFDDDDNQVSYCEVWVSDLALVTRNYQGAGKVEGFVLDAKTGDPIAAAKVRAWYLDNGRKPVPLPLIRTDDNGLFQLARADRRNLLIHASHNGQALSSTHHLHTYINRTPPRTNQRTLFFTDRSLYRPGQTIRYKGICISFEHQSDNYRTLAGQELTVVFSDPNGKEIERVKHRSGRFGSFSGSVTAPRDRLMGSMSIAVEANGPRGRAVVQVEEYKRPKFQVEFEALEESAKLGDTVKLRGKATAYTGASINDAQVRWRVVRQIRYPSWWYWRFWWRTAPVRSQQEIAHGSSSTAADGSFTVEFTPKPDLSVSPDSEPTFQFSVYADVTDTTGETRSAQSSLNVGYTALAAQLSAADWLTDDEAIDVKIRTTTLDGEGQAAEGVIKIHTLKEPARVARQKLPGRHGYWPHRDGRTPDPSNPNSWELDETVFESEFETDAAGNVVVSTELPAGLYRATLETADRYGKPVTASLPLQVLDPQARHLSLKIPNLLAAPQWQAEPGEDFVALWGSGYQRARAYVEVEHRGKILQSFWTQPDTTQVMIKQAIGEAMRGGLTLRTTMVRENRAYLQSRRIGVPWSNKQLKVKWEHFISKLEPAQQETWTAVITGPDAEAEIAEMVATLYDASLDAYRSHRWQSAFNVFRYDRSLLRSQFENQHKVCRHIYRHWHLANRDGSLNYRHFPQEIVENLRGYDYSLRRHSEFSLAFGDRNRALAADADGFAPAGEFKQNGNMRQGKSGAAALAATAAPNTPDLSNVSARKNLNETAFFFPHLISNQQGEVKLQFTMPEALTQWKFLGFAHDNELRGGLLSGTVVTAKELMVQPNPPRFLREGDIVEFTVKVSNQSPTGQQGTIRLTLAEADTGKSADERLGNIDRDQEFDIPAGESKSLSWRLSVPDGLGVLIYKAVASTGRLSDGEQGFLPVLSRRVLITESLPLPIRGQQTKQFDFERLRESEHSESLRHQSLTVQMVSNPSWYAVMALPYLMEYPYECSEQTFNRLYANSLAHHISGSDPKIQQVFERWRATPALDSPLEKNEDLKALLVEETPWYRQAQAESQARRNVGILFDINRLRSETEQTLHKLNQMQLPSGAWPWFPGGGANDYITLYITTGFGRLRHLGVDLDSSPAVKSLHHLDAWATKQYQRIKPENRHLNHLTHTIAFYLYGRSFFLKDQAVAPQHATAVKYWLAQAQKHWLELNHRQSQAHLAVALKRFGEPVAAQAIMASIKERSVHDDEMGMFWRDLERSWWWYRAPIETQAMMIEAFDEVMNDQQAVEECKVWLLKQKQTQDWKTTKATADAIYALLLRGSDLLASDALVEVALGGDFIQPDQVEAGTGFYEQRFLGDQIKPNQAKITVTKKDDGVAWGSVHWQYLEDISKVTVYDGTPLQLSKQIFIKQHTRKGPALEPVDGPVKVGDELVVRIVLRTDRDMEYVHLKDHRGSGTEPVNVLSQYKYQDGLGYYESTRDTASHFFIDYLPKGTYVFEYSTRVQLRGKYQTGMASLQCMYAPEFNSHS